MICTKADCVFKFNGQCRIPEDKNFILFDDNNELHCINYITNIKDVSKEALQKYFKR